MTSLIIRGGTVVNHDHSRRADVLVDGETIVAIGAAIDAPAGAQVVDAGGCYVMPGGIDPHTHLELGFMGSVSADDFEWGTKAALTGGTTMVVDFCIPDPGQSMLAAYQDWRRKSEKAASDYGFHMAVTSWSKQVFKDHTNDVIGKFRGFHAFALSATRCQCSIWTNVPTKRLRLATSFSKWSILTTESASVHGSLDAITDITR